jgi:hypothetical protein
VSSGRPDPPARRAPWEYALLAALLAAGMAFVVLASRRAWFEGDAWIFLVRRDAGDLLEPLGGHLVPFNLLVTRALYGIAGLDFSPLFPIVRAAAWAAFVGTVWWILRSRRTDPLVAAGVAGVLLFLGPSRWLAAWFVSNPISLGAVMIAAHLAAAGDRPNRRRLVALGGSALVAVLSGGAGVVGVGVLALVLAAGRRGRPLLPALAPAILLYGTWFLAFREGTPLEVGGGWSSVLRVPGAALEVLALAAARVIHAPEWVGWVMLPLIAAGIALLAMAKRIDRFGEVLLGSAAAYALAAAAVKVAPGLSSAEASLRYSHSIIVLALVGIAPSAAESARRSARVPAAAVLAVVLVVQGLWLADELALLEESGTRVRRDVGAAAWMVERGEPAAEGFRMDVRAGYLKVPELERLLSDGWDPPPPAPEVERRMRGDLRIRVRGGHPSWQAAGGGDLECTRLEPGASLAVVPSADSVLRVSPAQPGTLTVRWEDGYGTGVQQATLGGAAVFLQFAEPGGPAVATLETDGRAAVRVCSIGPLGAAR